MRINKNPLRKQLKQVRKLASLELRRTFPLQSYPHLRKIRSRPHAKIAIYLATRDEAPCEGVIRWAKQRQLQLFVPVIPPRGRTLGFVPLPPYPAKTHPHLWMRNRYGIWEPRHTPQQCYTANQLDLLVMPLVGYADAGVRLGMGGGYYDYSLRHKQRKPHARPFLLGLAYRCQYHPHIPADPWDIRLQACLTEQGLKCF